MSRYKCFWWQIMTRNVFALCWELGYLMVTYFQGQASRIVTLLYLNVFNFYLTIYWLMQSYSCIVGMFHCCFSFIFARSSFKFLMTFFRSEHKYIPGIKMESLWSKTQATLHKPRKNTSYVNGFVNLSSRIGHKYKSRISPWNNMLSFSQIYLASKRTQVRRSLLTLCVSVGVSEFLLPAGRLLCSRAWDPRVFNTFDERRRQSDMEYIQNDITYV